MEATCSKGWGRRCASSKGHKCACQCGGKNHGKDVQPHLDTKVAGVSKASGVKRQIPSGEAYRYRGYHGCTSKCGLNIYIKGDRAVVIFTELPNNPGTSITNMIDVLATQIYHERLRKIPVENILFVEHYFEPDEHYDLVFLKWTGVEFKNPSWRRIGLLFDHNKYLEGGSSC